MEINLEKLQEEFSIRYYWWALEDFKREVEQEFPFLQSIKDESTKCAVKMMSEMDDYGKKHFLTSLVKRSHEEAVKAIGETITADERQLCERYFNQALQLNTQVLVARLKYGVGKGRRLVSRAKIRRLVKNEFKKTGIHLAEDEDLDGMLTYNDRVVGWDIITRIYTRDRDSQVSYDHAIWSVDKIKRVTLPNGKHETWPIRLGHSVSFLSWLGISGQTGWHNLSDGDCPQVADELVKLYFHFLGVAPKLLKGLSVS